MIDSSDVKILLAETEATLPRRGTSVGRPASFRKSPRDRPDKELPSDIGSDLL
jgi:hypothetical protein